MVGGALIKYLVSTKTLSQINYVYKYDAIQERTDSYSVRTNVTHFRYAPALVR